MCISPEWASWCLRNELFFLTAARSGGVPGVTVMSSLWQQDSTKNGNLSGMRMNGEGTGIGAPTPAVVGYLGKVSYAQFSPSVTRAKLRSNLVCVEWKLFRIESPPQTRKNTEIYV